MFLLFSREPVKGSSFFLSIFLAVQPEIDRSQFDVRLRPSGIRVHYLFEIACSRFQLSLRTLQPRPLITRDGRIGFELQCKLQMLACAI